MIGTTMQQVYDELESMVDGTIAPSEFVGDPMNDNPSEDTTRIYFQNLNGLCWTKDGGRWPYICDAMSSIQADIACFSELNTDTNRYHIRAQMETICRHHFDQNRLVTASATTKSSSIYKPGGTAILACNSITTRINSHTRDRMGRWASLCIQISPTKKLRIISAYQVCTNRNSGTNTAASQQVAQLILERPSNQYQQRSPRQSFIHDLHTFIKQSQTNGEDILLAGDFNEEISSPHSGMHRIATTCNLVDLFSHRLGTSRLPITYQRGSKRLDYVLLSSSLLPSIQAAGYDPFGYRLPSDHRGMYIDFSTDSLFHHITPQITSSAKREFRTSSPGIIKKYIMAKMKYLHEHRFFDRLHTLDNLTESNHALAETLDRDLERASHHAARVCTQKSRPPWSPQLARAWAELHYYRLLLSASRTTANFEPAIQKLKNQWPDLPSIQPIEHHDLLERQKQALAALKIIRSEAHQSREEFLIRQYARALEADDTHKARILQKIIRAETQHKVYCKLRNLRNRDNGSHSLHTLKIPRNALLTDVDTMKQLPDDADHWETITIPQQIEHLLIQRNQHHFRQAEGTPFTRPPFLADIGYKADGYAAELILSGQIQYHHTSEATSLLIAHLQKRTLNTINGLITYDEVLNKLKKWDERTTTSPSGLHLGHYHCSWRDPRIDIDDPLRALVITQQKQILQATVSLLNYAIKFGYTYVRWTKIVNVMIQKDIGNPRIHRLRVIHLYEADYNLLLAVKWRQALYFAESNNLLNDGLYGSRPGRSALDPALMEVLQNEMYRMSMKAGINYDLDASSCYDRILTNVAVLSSRRVGMCPKVAHVNALTLEQSKYHLKTQLGTSAQWYSHSIEHPVHGTGQGSGNSPTIWCFVCSVLFDAFASSAHGATFSDYMNKIHTPIFMIGFVDDCTQRVNRFEQPNQPCATDLILLMEQDAQLWNDLLWSSGGALEQTKCSYHLIESDWNSSGHPFLKGGVLPQSIHICHQDRRIPTTQKSNYDAHKTLGCYINPAYTRTQPWKILSKKNESFASLLETNFLSRQEAWIFYSSIYLPSITYPLPITPLTRSQCTQLDARLLRTLLPRCGYNRNMSRAIRYAPFSVGGAGFKDLYIEQGALMLQNVVKYFNSPATTIGKTLLMTASWTQAFLGTSKFFLTDPSHPVPPVSPSFLMDIRTFLHDIQGSIVLQEPPIPALLRLHDRCIMDIVMSQSRWKPFQIIQINSCRRYLQAQTLADITNMRGTRLLPHTFNGTPEPDYSAIRVSTFNQKRPCPPAWRTWRKFLRTICDANGVLVNPLSRWIVDVTSCRHWPPFLYDPVTDTFMTHSRGSQYSIHFRYRPGCFSVRPTPQSHQGFGFPTATHMVMDTLRPDKNFLAPEPIPLPEVSIGGSYKPRVQSWDYELLRHCRCLATAQQVETTVSTSNLVTCSDGSVTDNGGSFGFVISDETGHRIIKGNGMVPGSFPNSFRSESYGVLATVRWLAHAYHAHPPTQTTTVTHYIDNRSVIQRIQKARQTQHTAPNTNLLPEQDVIKEIVYTLGTLPVQVDFEWIRGHQDETQAYHRLPLPAQLNCDADSEANTASQENMNSSNRIPPLPHSPCQLYIHDNSITAHLKQRVHNAYSVPRLHEYWRSRFAWSQDTLDTVHGELYSQIIKKYKEKWTTLVKHLHAISPTGHIAHRNNPLLPHECPTCLSPQENNHHVLQCPHPSRAKWRQQTILKSGQYKAGEVDPHLLDILRDGLTRYHLELEALRIQDYPAQYSQLICTQNSIGWDQLYKGRWSIQWTQLQDQYAEQSAQTGTLKGKQWLLGLGRLLIDQWFQVWKMRNEDRHTRDNTNLAELRAQLIHTELRHLYTYRLQVCPIDRHLFQESVEAHIQHQSSLDVLEDWIHTYKPAILASVEQAHHLGISRNRILTDYSAFNPIAVSTRQASPTAGLSDG